MTTHSLRRGAWIASTTVAFALLCGCSSEPKTGYMGPGSTTSDNGVPTVSQILANPDSGQDVQLEGHLVRKVKDETYLFTDGTGEITAEIDDSDLPKHKPIDADTKITIVGEVDTHSDGPPDIEVKSVHVVH